MPLPLPRLRLPRVVLALTVLVLAGLVAAAAFSVWTVRRSFPQYDGRITLPGLEADVEVLRDDMGIPQVYASNAGDLFRAQGYLHAQDRFWEMDYKRHVTSGRISELFGEDYVETDAFVRTLGWQRTAEAELELLSDESRAYLEAYADGVNSYLSTRESEEMSLEYSVLEYKIGDYRPDPWTPVDSLAWLKAMAWSLRGNVDDEVDRVLLAETVPKDRIDQLYPDYPYDRHDPTVTEGAVVDGRFEPDADPDDADMPQQARAELAGMRDTLDALPTALQTSPSAGSNAWVVSGDHTTSGKPLLANDPHLATSMPSTWYQMGLHCTEVTDECPFEVAGYSFAGVPGIIIGHNDQVSWGLTNLGADVSDLYVERLQGDHYEVDGRRRKLKVRYETIRVAGANPVNIRVRESEHGPLLSDVDDEMARVSEQAPVPGRKAGGDETEYGVALQWTALEPGTTMEAIFAIDKARDWKSFRKAAELFTVPAQNLLYADVDGHIGYQAPGRIPVRSRGEGRWPVPGWDSSYRWRGYIPFDELPYSYDPESGYLVSGNQAAVGEDYPYHLADTWSYGYRSQRVDQLLRREGQLDAADMERIQGDTWNAGAAMLTPYLQDIAVDDFTDEAKQLLRGWDHTQPDDSAAAAYYNAVWRHVLELTFHDEMPEETWPDGDERWVEVMRGLLQRPQDPWWDDVNTEDYTETRDMILRRAMVDARLEMTQLQGKDPDRWRWGRVHKAELENESLGRSGIGLVEELFNRGPYHLGGGPGSVNANSYTAHEGYEVDWAPSMRMVVDLADLDKSRWINSTGVSGHAFDDHYADQAGKWADNETIPWQWRRETVEEEADHHLTFVPESPG